MSASTPADLAVTFRSLDRRRREAIGDADPAAVSGLAAELQRHIDAAAAVIDRRPTPTRWPRRSRPVPPTTGTRPRSTTLRRHALDAGAVLRRIAAAAEAAQR